MTLMTEIELPGAGAVAVKDRGNRNGPAVLLAHGGAGPASFAQLAGLLAPRARVVIPTHPGFDGRPRPDGVDGVDTVADLAVLYLDLLDALDLRDVLVVGNSMGGWLAAELALRDTAGRIGGLVLLNAVGIRPAYPGEIVDIGGLAPDELGKLSFHDQSKRPVPSGPEDVQRVLANQRTLAVYAGDPYCHDPRLHRHLHRVGVPVLVGWGESDGVVPVDYGRRYASLFPRGRFELIPEAGHLPQVEQPERVAELVTSLR